MRKRLASAGSTSRFDFSGQGCMDNGLNNRRLRTCWKLTKGCAMIACTLTKRHKVIVGKKANAHDFQSEYAFEHCTITDTRSAVVQKVPESRSIENELFVRVALRALQIPRRDRRFCTETHRTKLCSSRESVEMDPNSECAEGVDCCGLLSLRACFLVMPLCTQLQIRRWILYGASTESVNRRD